MTDTDREAFEAWWATMNEAPYYEGIQERVALNAWQAATQRQQSRIAELEAELQVLRNEREELASFVIEVGGYWGHSKSVLVGPDSLANVLNGAIKRATKYEYLTQTMGDLCITYADKNTGPVLKAGAADAAIDAAMNKEGARE